MGFLTVFRHILIFILLICSYQANSQSVIPGCKALFEDREFRKAREILNTVKKGQPEYAEALYYLGRIAVEEIEYETSVSYFEDAVAADSKVPEYHNWLGVMYGVLAMNSNPVKQAYLAPKIKSEFEKSAALDPSNLQTQWGLISYYTKAPGFLGGSWEKAFASAKIISTYNKAQGVRALGFIHGVQKKNELAEKEFMEAISMEPSNPEHLLALGQFYEDLGKFDKAFALYDENIKRNPGNMVINFHLGKASAQMGTQVDRGISSLNQYLNYKPRPNEPSHCDASVFLGMLYEKKGDKSKARYCYESSLKIYPGMKEAKAGLARLN